MPAVPAPDTSLERIALEAPRAGYSTTSTGVILGLGCMAGGVGARSGGIFLTGLGVLTVGVLAGPAVGWDRAGYTNRGAVGVLVRLGILGGALAIPVANPATRHQEFTVANVIAWGLTGVAAATVEGYGECGRIAAYVRRRGPGHGVVVLVPSANPSGAPGLALVTRFP